MFERYSRVRRVRHSLVGCRRKGSGRPVAVLLVMASYWGLIAATTGGKPGVEVLPPGYTELAYEPPPPGSYRLPPLGAAVNGEVLRTDGTATTLHTSYDGKIVVLAFIYTRCTDLAGCPLATVVLHKLKGRLRDEPQFSQNLRLISLSFDPTHDTPAVMRSFAADFDGAGVEWQFLTTSSERQLMPILEGYQQSRQQEYDEYGVPSGTFAHILRVFLIDRQQRIRNIYSVSFLHADVLINDIKTLLLEADGAAHAADVTAVAKFDSADMTVDAGDQNGSVQAWDNKNRYRGPMQRQDKSVNLLRLVKSPQLGLPPVPVPQHNPITAQKIALGRKLFYDRRLSLNDTFSCAMCHIPNQGFTSNEMATAVGVEGRTVRRNAPTLYNTAFLERLFHDGREFNLEQQVWSPLLAHNEMANPSVGTVIEKIKRIPEYEGLFEEAFAGRGPSMETIGMAIASYERALVSANSAFDRWYYGKDEHALGDAAKRGFALFTGQAACVSCHRIEEDQALFADHRLHNTGIGYHQSMRAEPQSREIMVAPGVVLNVAREVIDSVSEQRINDLGLYEITQNPHDRWKYKTPTLRNVALTAPYMHDGSIGSLKEVVEFYNRGGIPNEGLDSLIRPLDLSELEVNDLVAFLESLTGANVDALVSDALAAPVGDLTQADPNWAHDGTSH